MRELSKYGTRDPRNLVSTDPDGIQQRASEQILHRLQEARRYLWSTRRRQPEREFTGRDESFRRDCTLPERSCGFSLAAGSAAGSTNCPPSAVVAAASSSPDRSRSSSARDSFFSGACGSCRRRPRSNSRCKCRNGRTRSRCRTVRTCT